MQVTKSSDISSSIEFYTNDTRPNIDEKILSSINGATRSIVIFSPEIGNPNILEALKQKSEACISVRLILDREKVQKKPLDLPSNISITCPQISVGTMHRKIIVIDEKEVIWGSANLTYIGDNSNLMTSVISEMYARFILQEADFIEKALPEEKKVIRLKDSHDMSVHLTPGSKNALDIVLRLLSTAKKSVRVAMFTFSHKSIAYKLSALQGKGIKVQVILDKSEVKEGRSSVYEFLKSSKVPIFVTKTKNTKSKYPLMHHKFCFIDDRLFIHGSLNWTVKAFTQNHDLLTLFEIQGPENVKKINDIWEGLEKRIDLSFSLVRPNVLQKYLVHRPQRSVFVSDVSERNTLAGGSLDLDNLTAEEIEEMNLVCP